MSQTVIYDAAAIAQAVTFEDLLEPTEQAFIAYSRGEAQSPIAVLHPVADSDLHVKPAAMLGHPYSVVKMATWSAAKRALGQVPNAGFVAVFDALLGDPVALLFDDHYLTDLRTQAAGAIATRALARGDSRTLAVLGTGQQAYLQAAGVRRVLPIETIVVWGRDQGRRDALVRRLQSEACDAVVIPGQTARKAIEMADIIVAATASREPVVRGSWLRPGQHVTSVGSDEIGKRELDATVLRRADILVVDSRELAGQVGSLAHPTARREDGLERITAELGELLAGSAAGRSSDTDITVATLVGLGVQDLVAAEVALSRLRADT